MLILGRKTGESIMLDDDVVVTVLSIKKMYVRLGIEAPPDVKVHREEVYGRIKDEESDDPSCRPDVRRGDGS